MDTEAAAPAYPYKFTDQNPGGISVEGRSPTSLRKLPTVTVVALAVWVMVVCVPVLGVALSVPEIGLATYAPPAVSMYMTRPP